MSSDRAQSWGPTFLRWAVGWTCCIALVVGGLSLVAEPAMLLSNKTPWSTAIATGLIALSLAALMALPLAPIMTAFSLLTRYFDARPRLRRLWPLPIALASIVVGWVITEATVRSKPLVHTAVLVLFAAPIVTLYGLTRTAPRRLIVLTSILLGLFSLVIDLSTPRDVYPEFHDLFVLLTVTSGMAATEPLRQFVMKLNGRVMALIVLSMTAASLGIIDVVDAAMPWWRSAATAHGHYTHRLARTLRLIFDLDADGFSPIAWGGDCDDFDSERNPMVTDSHGHGDANCNGVDPPAEPTDADRGLSPAKGDPDLAPGAVDLVVLITIDCWRHDAFSPSVMPRLWSLAANGTVFNRAYSGATSTRVSTRLIQRGTNHALPIALRMKKFGVTSTAVIGLRDGLFSAAIAGFDHVERPSYFRWSAEEVTGHALTDLRLYPEGKHYLWIHYYDAHTPYEEYERVIEGSASMTPPSHVQYLAELAKIDASIGLLVDRLRSSGRLARTAILVAGDHGEGFGEHDVMRHHVSGYEAVMRIPSMIIAPGVPALRYPGLVTHRDIPATIAGLFGRVSADPSFETWGRSWLRLRAAPTEPLHEFVAVRSGRSASGNTTLVPILVIVEGKYKLVRGLSDGIAELYNPVDQPDELRDLTSEARGTETILRYHAALYRDLDQWPDWPQVIDTEE